MNRKFQEKDLVLATHNYGKIEEFKHLFGKVNFNITDIGKYSGKAPEENGESFWENSLIKARAATKLTGLVSLADDSGLCVDVLNGAPGIYSARFSGEGATDDSNNQLLIEKLSQTPLEKRQAYYTCHMALSDPDGNIRESVECYCHGRIRFEAAGTAGFGYDPYFEVPEYHKSFGQLGDKVKSILSHRARAMRQLVPKLQKLILDGHWP